MRSATAHLPPHRLVGDLEQFAHDAHAIGDAAAVGVACADSIPAAGTRRADSPCRHRHRRCRSRRVRALRAASACQRSSLRMSCVVHGARALIAHEAHMGRHPRRCPTATAAACGWCGSSPSRRRATARYRPARRDGAPRRSSGRASGCHPRPRAWRRAAANHPSSDRSRRSRCTPRPSRPRPWSRGRPRACAAWCWSCRWRAAPHRSDCGAVTGPIFTGSNRMS